MENHVIVTLEETDEILYFRDGVFFRGGEIVIKKRRRPCLNRSKYQRWLGEIRGI